jgi:hypothetical protein
MDCIFYGSGTTSAPPERPLREDVPALEKGGMRSVSLMESVNGVPGREDSILLGSSIFPLGIDPVVGDSLRLVPLFGVS